MDEKATDPDFDESPEDEGPPEDAEAAAAERLAKRLGSRIHGYFVAANAYYDPAELPARDPGRSPLDLSGPEFDSD